MGGVHYQALAKLAQGLMSNGEALTGPAEDFTVPGGIWSAGPLRVRLPCSWTFPPPNCPGQASTVRCLVAVGDTLALALRVSPSPCGTHRIRSEWNGRSSHASSLPQSCLVPLSKPLTEWCRREKSPRCGTQRRGSCGRSRRVPLDPFRCLGASKSRRSGSYPRSVGLQPDALDAI